MVFPKLASLHINYSQNTWPSKGITNANILLVSGATSGKTSRSAWWLIILASRSKVTNIHNMDHFINALKEHYTMAIDLMGSLFCGIHLTWNYTLGHIDCHMPGYINKALKKYQHPKPVSPQHAPYKAALIQYGARVQRVEVDTTQPLFPKEIKCI
jgi:hypothetical protein